MPQSTTQTAHFRRQPGLAARFFTTVMQTLARRRDRMQLARLDQHMLRDIGLDADSAAKECAKPFWRP